ncbi:MAG: type II toxin-antitoxin system RelE/ParE family toxin [Rhodomicrobium sp.]
MTWEIEFDDAFEAEFAALAVDVQDALLAAAKLLAEYGPLLKRPHADTLNGSKHANMKELRFEAADGEWRAAFAFDPNRKAILLVAGDKSGGSEKRFYRQLIAKADRRFSAHLECLKAAKKGK